MGLFNFFRRRRKEVTPAQMKAMMSDLKNDFYALQEIDDESIRNNQANIVYKNAVELLDLVRFMTEVVSDRIKQVEPSTWWATNELKDRDYSGLMRGKHLLNLYENDIIIIISQLKKMGISENQEESGNQQVGPQ